ncbi:oxygen-independent coproporphyrinogen III oxidase [Negadavirga shengliensis]|uniref:Coproporphyrinogen-III oxidase n=1 Tax=Negadavirga shengliensis TaxID=1389218 RepID=A0ABV9T4J1_9BACT
MMNADLIQKYNVPAPRYTSYPPVPFWNNELSHENWPRLFQKAYHEFGEEGISLYIHLPYCESLCTYCGCNKRITKNHQVELPYISAIVKEWNLYLDMLRDKPKLAGIHLGGGTPTFFSPASLSMMLRHILSTSTVAETAEFSFEGHPNNTTYEHLAVLNGFGFDRVSYGIQDFNPKVQVAIHRIQPYKKVEEATSNAREIGYKSINYDLIYGLPHQTLKTLKDTIAKVNTLRPDRIAFYSYAHLPTVFPSQRSFEKHLPNEREKRELYENGKLWLSQMGYYDIGMDHFALQRDPLFKAKETKTLHRNFMGYTTSPSKILIGLGCSAISDLYYAYGQNEKHVEDYKTAITDSQLPLIKGHTLNQEDILMKKLIMDLICNGEADWTPNLTPLPEPVADKLTEFKNEGLLDFCERGIRVNEHGKTFIRNICMAIDPYFQTPAHAKPVFSKSI